MLALAVQQHGTGSPATVLPPPSRRICIIKCKGKEEGQRASPVVHPCGVQDSESTPSLHQVCEWVWGLPSLEPDDRGIKTNIFETACWTDREMSSDSRHGCVHTPSQQGGNWRRADMVASNLHFHLGGPGEVGVLELPPGGPARPEAPQSLAAHP